MDWQEAMRIARQAMASSQPFTGYDQRPPTPADAPVFGSSGGSFFGGGPPSGGPGGGHPFNRFVPGATQPSPGAFSLENLLDLLRGITSSGSAGPAGGGPRRWG